MANRIGRGIDRSGLDESFEVQETRKSELILQGKLLRETGRDEAADDCFAEAAQIEEGLVVICRDKGLQEKAWVHHYSAASCWAEAGDFYHALRLCDSLLEQGDLPIRLREHVSRYAKSLRSRRAAWYASLTVEAAEGTHA